MPNPTASDVHFNALLTNVSIAYMQREQDFVADRVFPTVPVEHQADSYRTYDRADWLRIEAQERAPGTESVGGGWRFGTDTYNARIYAVHKDIDDPTRANADSVFNLDRDSTEYVTRQLLLKREKLWADKHFATGVWGRDRTGVASGPTGTQFIRWDAAGSDPLEDIKTEIIRVAELTGVRMNTLVLSPWVWYALSEHALIIDKIKYVQRGVLSTDLVASLMEIDQILVPWCILNTAPEGAAAGAYSFVFGKNALLTYAAPNAGLLNVSGGYTFAWRGYIGRNNRGIAISKMRADLIKSDRIEGEMAFDMKVVAPELGVFYTGAVA